MALSLSIFKLDTSGCRSSDTVTVRVVEFVFPAESLAVYVYSTAEPSTLVSKVAFVIVVILPEYFGSPSVATAPGI